MIIATVKAAVLFVSISELEEFTTRIALYSAPVNAERQQAGLIDNEHEREGEDDGHGDEIEVAINYTHQDSFLERGRANLGFYRKIKKLLHPFVLVFSLCAAIYISVKFGFVLNLIVKNRASETSLPMTMFFFTILATEVAFAIVEFVFSLFTWTFMRRIRQFVLSKLEFSDNYLNYS